MDVNSVLLIVARMQEINAHGVYAVDPLKFVIIIASSSSSLSVSLSRKSVVRKVRFEVLDPLFVSDYASCPSVFAAALIPSAGLRIPSSNLTHRSLPHCRLDLNLHTFHSLFKSRVFFRITFLASSLPDPPEDHNKQCYRDGDGKIDPDQAGNDRRRRGRGVTGG